MGARLRKNIIVVGRRRRDARTKKSKNGFIFEIAPRLLCFSLSIRASSITQSTLCDGC